MKHWLLAQIAVLLVWALSIEPCHAAAELTVRYPAVQHPYYSKRDEYYVALLKMALERSGEPYTLTGVRLPDYSEKRSVLLIRADQYDVHWLNTTPERERALLPVRVPLEKGAIGWRAILIREDMQPAFDKVQSVADLKSFVFVQGHDWPDVPVLVKNGFQVERSSNWPGLFRMVALNRAQAFPRSVVEIIAEQKEDVAKGLVIENDIILHYPAAYYFFVAKDNARLANALERGLKKSIEDGSFDKLFFKNFGEPIAALNLPGRKVLTIDYPELKVEDEKLWFSVDWFENLRRRYAQNDSAPASPARERSNNQ